MSRISQGNSGTETQSVSKKLKNAKTVFVNKSKTSKKFKVKKANKPYYVRVRAYVKRGSKYYYSTWSNSKHVYTK